MKLMKAGEHDPIIRWVVLGISGSSIVGSEDIHRMRTIYRNMPVVFAVLAV
jgi:hypothetical protein